MEYVHPKKYKGLQIDTPNNQAIIKVYVEENCLRCDLFNGRDHNFSECNRQWANPECTCPKECRRPTPLADAHLFIKCRSE